MQLDKKLVLISLFFIICLLIPNITYGHSGDKIKKVFINIEIQEDGSALFKEEWYANSFDRYGYTKLFKGIDSSQISNYSVTDEEQNVYELTNDFSLDGKSGAFNNKCGIISNDQGVYLFWGVNRSKDHQYTLTYTVNNFIKEFPDLNIAKGINFEFIDQRNKSTNLYYN